MKHVILPESEAPPARCLTLNDATTPTTTHENSEGFIYELGGPVVIDEVQHAPDLFLTIKAAVDRRREPERFLLADSADVLLLLKELESLARSTGILNVWPFSRGRPEERREQLVDVLFGDDQPALPSTWRRGDGPCAARFAWRVPGNKERPAAQQLPLTVLVVGQLQPQLPAQTPTAASEI